MLRVSDFGRVIDASGCEGFDPNVIRLAQRRLGNARSDGGRLARETRDTHATGTDVKDSRASVLRVQWPMGVAIRSGVSKVTLLHEVTGVFKELTRPWDETPHEESSQACHDDSSHRRVILGGGGGSVNHRSTRARSECVLPRRGRGWPEKHIEAYTPPVRTRRSLFLLLLLLILPMGLSEAGEDRCARPCQQDESDQPCPPDCQFWGCCSISRAVVIADGFVPPGLFRGASLARREIAIPRSPEPHEIFHVPKPALA